MGKKNSRVSLRTSRKSTRKRATKRIKMLKRSKAVDSDFSKRFMHTRRKQENPSCKNADWPSNRSQSEPDQWMIVAAKTRLTSFCLQVFWLGKHSRWNFLLPLTMQLK